MRIQAWPEQEKQGDGTTSSTFPDRSTAPKTERWRNKVAMTEVLKTPKFAGKSPSGKTNRLLCAQTSSNEVAKGENACNMDMFPNVQISERQVDANSETSENSTTHQKLQRGKKSSASVAIHIPSNDERQMQLPKIQSDDTREQVRSEKRFFVPTLGNDNYIPVVVPGVQANEHQTKD